MTRDRWNMLILFCLAFASRGIFSYRGGMGDPDPIAIAAGMAMAITGNLDFSHAFLYGRHVSPGMYFVVKGLYPLFFDSPVHLILFLNWMSILCAALSASLLYRLFRLHLSPQVAMAAIVVFLFSPVVWEATTYFHPLIPAFLLLLAALLFWRHIAWTPRGAAAFVLTVLCALVGFCIRVEILFVLPALLLWGAISERKHRNSILVLVVTAMSFFAYFIMVRQISDAADPRLYGLGDYIRKIPDLYQFTVSPVALIRSSTWAILGIGAFTIIGVIISGWRRAALRSAPRPEAVRPTLLLVAAAWSLPSLLFWLAHPVPMLRHYVLSTLGIVWALALLSLRHASARRVAGLTAVVVAANLLLPEGAYRLYNKTHPSAPKTPHGTFFYYHERQLAVIDRYHKLQVMVTDTASARSSVRSGVGLAKKIVLVNWEGYGYMLYALATSPMPLDVLPRTEHKGRVFVHPYRLAGVEVEVVHARIADTLASDVVTASARESPREVAIYVPKEASFITTLQRIENARVVVY